MGWNITFLTLLFATYNRDYYLQHTNGRNGNKFANNQNYYLSNNAHIFTNDDELKILITEPLEGDIDKNNTNICMFTCHDAFKHSLIDDMVFATYNTDHYLSYNESNTTIISAVRDYSCIHYAFVTEIELISKSLCLNKTISLIPNRESYFIIDNKQCIRNNQNYYLNDDCTHIFTNDNEPKILIIEPLEGDIDKYNKNVCIFTHYNALKESLIDDMVFTTCNIDYYLPCNVREIELISNSLSLNNIISKIANREPYFIIDDDNNKQFTSNNCSLETFPEIYFNGEYKIMFMRSGIKVINDSSCTIESNDTHDGCYVYTIDISFDKYYTFLFANAPITNKYPNDFNRQTVYTFKQNIFHHLRNAEGTECNDTDVMTSIVILNKDIAVIDGRCSESNNVLNMLVLLFVNNDLIAVLRFHAMYILLQFLFRLINQCICTLCY